MKTIRTGFLSIFAVLMISACSVFGEINVEKADYKTIETHGDIEVRHYEEILIVSTPMATDRERNSAFSRLFNYISGNNQGDRKIPMTAPVFMDPRNSNDSVMSFVLPSDYTLETAPIPEDPDVTLGSIKDSSFAVIQFSGRLNVETAQEKAKIVSDWIQHSDYVATGPYKMAGYNSPMTIPAMRRNEVLIPIQKKAAE